MASIKLGDRLKALDFGVGTVEELDDGMVRLCRDDGFWGWFLEIHTTKVEED